MSTPRDLDVADALDNLVNQFADPLVFLRELVQNALDAGSPEVDVYTEFRPSKDDPDQGVMVIGVDDYGEGMDREIIDSRLTRLFSSAKDQDFTKIGKFGIGFVSVFALRPDAVCVDTSRGGESWRILFKADRSFVRIEREQPVDGTKIQVLKQATRSEYEEISGRARTTLRFWCKHVRGTVRFDDVDVHEPFELPGALCSLHHEEEGVRVVAGYLPGAASSFGFYNQGLTLLEGDTGSFFAGVGFKVDSKYLEHTLARDNIMRDANFDKAMAVVEGLVGARLDRALLQRIGQLLREGPGDGSLVVAQEVAAGLIERRGVSFDGPLLALVDGRLATASTVAGAAKAGRLWTASVRSALVDAVVEAGHTVVALPPRAEGTKALLRALAGRRVDEAPRSFIQPPPGSERADRERWEPLRAALAELLQALGVRVAGVAMARFDYPHSCILDRTFVLQPEPGALTPWTTDALRPMERWKKKDTLVINAVHPFVVPLHTLVQREREFAAYTLLKLVNLAAGPLPVEVDARLATASTELRAQRQEGAR